MAFCTKCGTQLTDGAKFCASCGTSAEGKVSESKPTAKKESVFEKLPTAEAKEKLNTGKEKVNAGINKLPFRKLAEEKIPAGARTKFPILDKVIPFANQIVCGLAVLLIVVIIAASGDDNSPKGLAKQTYKLEQKALKLKEDSPKAISLAQEAMKIMEKVTKLSANDGLVYLQELGRLQTGISASKSNKKASSNTTSGSKSAAPASPSTQFAKSDTAEADFEVALTSDGAGVVINKYIGSAAQVRIPATIQGMPVREIGQWAFCKDNNPITSVVIPEGVTIIRKSAFSGSTNFSNYNKLASISLPSTLTAIGEGTFSACRALTAIDLPAGLALIGNSAFAGSGLTSVTWPAGISTITERAFFDCASLTTVTIPEGVTTIGMYAFGSCKALASIALPSTIQRQMVEVLGVSYYEENIRNRAFADCTALTTVTIPNSVEGIQISPAAFVYCDKLDLASQSALRQRGWSGLLRD
jgi:hypothetical protein